MPISPMFEFTWSITWSNLESLKDKGVLTPISISYSEISQASEEVQPPSKIA